MLSLLQANVAHKFHMSKSLIEYVESEKAIQITMHLFIDDLEVAMKKEGWDHLFLCSEKEDPKADEYLAAYFEKFFAIELNGEKAPYHFLGKEVSEDILGVWCYMEIENVAPFKSIEVMNKALLDVFEDQKNIISIIGPNKEKGYIMLEKGKIKETVKF